MSVRILVHQHKKKDADPPKMTNTWTIYPTTTQDDGSRFALAVSGGPCRGLLLILHHQVAPGPGGAGRGWGIVYIIGAQKTRNNVGVPRSFSVIGIGVKC